MIVSALVDPMMFSTLRNWSVRPLFQVAVAQVDLLSVSVKPTAPVRIVDRVRSGSAVEPRVLRADENGVVGRGADHTDDIGSAGPVVELPGGHVQRRGGADHVDDDRLNRRRCSLQGQVGGQQTCAELIGAEGRRLGAVESQNFNVPDAAGRAVENQT